MIARSISRRSLMRMAGVSAAAALSGCVNFDGELWGECPVPALDLQWLNHPRVQELLAGLPTDQIWDSHVHLVGSGDSGSGIYINPALRSFAHPMFRTQFAFYLNAVCADDEGGIDKGAALSLQQRLSVMPLGFKAMVMAFDAWHHENGERDLSATAFYVPNEYAALCAQKLPERMEWIASVHPYRADALSELQKVIDGGARAIKWLPPSQGMDPASPLCDEFYEALARNNLPLIVHAGDEHATPGKLIQEYGNPLRLRRALERGVRVIIAHCASLGNGEDLDKRSGKPQAYIDYFARLMAEKEWQTQLYGDLSAVTLVNRDADLLPRLLREHDWHARLLQASDYPLPAVLPTVSLRALQKQKLLSDIDADLLMTVRRYNPFLFDLLLKRALRVDGLHFADSVFLTRRHFIAG